MVNRWVPVLNFSLAVTALTFQMAVLYPWHLQLDADFERLKAEQEGKLVEFHKIKLKRMEVIESMLKDVDDKLDKVLTVNNGGKRN